MPEPKDAMLPWHEGGKEGSMERFGVTLTHDDLCGVLGPVAVNLIESAGFVLVPRTWRESVFRALGRN